MANLRKLPDMAVSVLESVFYADVKLRFRFETGCIDMLLYKLCLLYTPVDFQQTNYNHLDAQTAFMCYSCNTK